jgi:hypothetical protein
VDILRLDEEAEGYRAAAALCGGGRGALHGRGR